MSSSFIRQYHKFFFLAATAAVLIFIGAGCSDSTQKARMPDIGTGPLTTLTKDPISKDAVEKLVNRKLGDAGVAGQPVIRSITITPEAGGKSVAIDLNRTASCHPGQLIGSSVTMSQQLMSALFRYPDVSRVQLALYGLTDEPQDLNTKVTQIMVTREAAAKIDWAQFSDANVEKLASEFWAEPSVYANWKIYGGGALTDPAAQAAANGGQTTQTPPNSSQGTTPTTP